MKVCPPDKAFWLEDERTLRSTDELADALSNMKPETFKHHVNEVRNDFANWIEHVFKQKNLAEQIRKAKTRENMRKILKPEKARNKVHKARKAITVDPDYKSSPEPASHIALAAHIALGIVAGSAVTLLVLMVL